LMEGLSAAGCRCLDVGVFPTPATIWLAADRGFFAAIVTASHNPYPDNGLKLVGPDGKKVAVEVEDYLEGHLREYVPPPDALNVRPYGEEAAQRYQAYVIQAFPQVAGPDVRKPPLYLDLAHGAAYTLYPRILRSMGWPVEPVHDRPDGTNINDRVGAVHPEILLQSMRASAPTGSLGFAYDGDADRAILVWPEHGVLDGHHLLAVLALYAQEQGWHSTRRAVVSTVMANQALETFLTARGIELIRTPVGDKYVLQAIEENGLLLGAEPSGHLICRSLSPTGDGLLTTLLYLTAWLERPDLVQDVLSSYRPYPQVLRNVPVACKVPLEQVPSLQEAIARAQDRLSGQGRMLIRYSGTEPVLRILVEAPAEGLAAEVADDLARLAGRILGPSGIGRLGAGG
ncbi:MAG: phosphoglucosamine mutase, partial [Acidobacteria bacterium]|nr:phosphoglucosamine mutase [Acidobacteriota bacterium]